MKKPSCVTIGTRDYKIMFTETVSDYGQYSDGKIYIDKSYDHGIQAETLKHEIIHAIWAHYALPDKIDEETAASLLSQLEWEVYKNNQEVFEFVWSNE